MSKSNKTHRTRSAVSGRFVKTGTEKRKPKTTVRERTKKKPCK